jgi:4-diphosphocytidyl-2C-methyl-D-erythritol kinase
MSGSGSTFFSIIEAREELKSEYESFSFIKYCKKIDCSLYQNVD